MDQSYSQNRREFLQGTVAAAAVTPLLASNLTAQDEESDKFYIQPYLQNPTADGMTICFAALDASDVQVRWGRAENALTETAPLSSLPISKITWLVWKARLANLKPGQKYYYRIDYREQGKQHSSEVYSFTPFDPQAKEVRAVVYNDVHDRIPTAEALVRHVKPEDFEFSIVLGDMWHDSSTVNNARRAFLNLEAYVRLFDGSNKPMLLVRGNHDVRGSFATQLSHLFDFSLNDPASEFAAQNAYYDFRVGPIWFIAPDSGEDGSKQMALYQPYRERQTKWLADLFSNSPHRQAPWRVLPTHIPLYYKGYWDAAHSRDMWEPILSEGNIDVSISGHIHASGIVPKGEEVVYVQDKGKPEEKTIRYTPPFPTFIGGGPSVGAATVTFLRASARRLELRALSANGEDVGLLSLNKKTGAAAVLDAASAQSTVLTFEITPALSKYTPMPQDYGAHVRASSMPGADGRVYGYKVFNGGTPNVAVAYSASHAEEERFKYTTDSTWVGAAWLHSRGMEGKGWFYITFTPDSSDVGVRMRSFELLSWDANNHGAEWRVYAAAIGGDVLASDLISTSQWEKRKQVIPPPSNGDGRFVVVDTGLTDFHQGKLVLAIRHVSGNGMRFGLDNVRFEQATVAASE